MTDRVNDLASGDDADDRLTVATVCGAGFWVEADCGLVRETGHPRDSVLDGQIDAAVVEGRRLPSDGQAGIPARLAGATVMRSKLDAWMAGRDARAATTIRVSD